MDACRDEEAGEGEQVTAATGSLPIDIKNARFPYCVVWSSIPIISWLFPYVGHMGICRSDGVILDFAVPYFVTVDRFMFGATARFVQLSVQQCCFPSDPSGHTCKSPLGHEKCGTVISWDDGLRSTTEQFQHKFHNLLICNCHSFAASCLNRFAYQRSIKWNMISMVTQILFKGQWVDKVTMVGFFSRFTIVMCIGLFIGGWSFFIVWAVINFLLIGWFVMGTYVFRCLVDH